MLILEVRIPGPDKWILRYTQSLTDQEVRAACGAVARCGRAGKRRATTGSRSKEVDGRDGLVKMETGSKLVESC